MTERPPPPVTAEIIRLSQAAAQAIPAHTLAMAKLCLLDWLGVAIGARSDPLVNLLRLCAHEEGGHPQASVIGAPERVSERQAALINGAMGHVLDFDDVNLAMRVHPSAVLWPGLIALCEHHGFSGAQLLRAFVTGYEAGGILGEYIGAGHYLRGFHATGTVGSFAAVAACAALLDLDDDSTARAYGITGTQAAGLKAQFGTMCKPLHAGRAAENGVTAARWVQGGLTSRSDIIEARQGFLDTQCDRCPDALPVWQGYHLDRNLFKFHVACFGTHGTLEALRQLRQDGLRPEEICSITLRVDAGADKMCNIAAPQTGLQAKFSLRFNAALAAYGYDTSQTTTYEDELTQVPELISLRDRVTVELSPSTWPEDITEVIVTTMNGRTVTARHDLSVPAGPLDEQAIRLKAKFIGLANPVIGSDATTFVIDQIVRIETLDTIDGLMAQICSTVLEN